MTAKKSKLEPPAPLAYLASPYSHDDPDVRHMRYRANVIATADLLHTGLVVFSPIVHHHAIACHRDLGRSMEAWEKQNFAFLDRATWLIVLQLDGWQESKGVAAEMSRANDRGINIRFLPSVIVPANFIDFEVK